MADDRSLQNKLKQLISDLSFHYDLTGEDIADVLWLALKQKEYSITELQKNVPPVGDEQENKGSSEPSIVNDVQSEPLQDSELSTPLEEEPSALLYPLESQNNSSINQKTIPLRHPDPPSLQQPLEFARTFRPLMRRVDSGRRTILDEVETVERTAEEGICIPILKSESEPWLDLALVVDENSSMIIWGNTVKELKQLLEHYGIFREVRTWGLTTDKDENITLRVKVGQKESFKNPQELIDPTHRRLILIVSDCVAPIWFDGTILSTLEDWTKHQPMAIVQMLPDSMWLRTGLRLGASVKLVNLIPGAANRNLRIHELLLWKDINLERGTKIPILTLNPQITSLWSDLVVGKYDRVMAGFVIPSASDFRPPPQLPQSQVRELNAEQRVKRFRKISSPLGRKLAGLLMAAPVITLPVVRLIQKTLLPQSQPVHVAEVFLGGLLKPLIEITTEINPDGVLFDVMSDRIRNILLDDAPFSDSVIIFETISDYIESHLEKSLRDCVGLLKGTSGNGKEETVAKAYAEISLKVLKGLGGSYRDFAEELEKSPAPPPAPEPSRDYDDPFLIIGKEPKTLTFEIATFEEIIETLSKIAFKIVTLVPKEQINNRPLPEDIYFREEHFSDSSSTSSRYQSYQELSNNEQEGIDYRIRYRQSSSDVAIVAHHGGKIQSGSTEIADAIAGEDYAFYSFEGLKEGSGNNALYIPSYKFDEPHALEIVSKATRVITIHGIAVGDKNVYFGGLNKNLKEQIKQSLKKAGFSEINDVSVKSQDANPQNICNRGQTGKGVQIGIPWGLRKQLFDSLKSESNEPTLFDRFIQAIRDALSPLEAAGLRSQITQGEADYYTEDLGNGVELDMVSIPGGSFMMGTEDEEVERLVKKYGWEDFRRERPQHEVNVPDFFMGRYPITQAQWREVAGWEQVETELDSDPSKFKEDYEGRDRWTRPVERVSWEEAKEFCNRLSRKTSREYRLPTEAEWEYACRAGTNTPFHFGQTITTDLANYGVEEEDRRQTTPVGYFKVVNKFGLSDMHGNVWEWCEDDLHDSYEGAPTDGSAWFSEESRDKIIRGGSWGYLPTFSRSAYRFKVRRVNHPYELGFRVVCVAPSSVISKQ